MADHTLDAQEVAVALYWAADDVRRHHAAVTPVVREVLLTLEGIADALKAGDSLTFEGDEA